ncbi:hypothetical protein HOLleu_15345 [Holothuria leucospilota]|uniref:Ig-like domain-containing protein n=1 Tax=Holothuria leucospilota TaxID=206669 RepID=A0A9Q1H9J5_HOLLE|nr:hypothetical protein HOLleu_15345 [Holothuria leucospilota]
MNSPTGKPAEGIRWRKDNSNFISSQSGSATFLIPGPILLSDAGTYECHYNGKRDMAKQALNLLLVRGNCFLKFRYISMILTLSE